MDDTDRALLSTALRTRPSTVAELAELAGLPGDRVIELLDGGAGRGIAARDGDRLRYLRPDRAIADRIAALAARQESRRAEEAEELRELSEELPRLVTDWFSGTDEHLVQVEVLHGVDSANELWTRQRRRRIPSLARAVLPDVRRFLVADERRDLFIDTMSQEGRHARAIIGVADARRPEIRAQLPAFHQAGLRIRMHPRPPSWFWLHDDRTAALPLTWGETWPTSVMAVHSAPIVAALDALFQRLWDESVPADSPGADWDELLRLMRTGLTLETASRTLGIAPRTGRRRIAAAMRHYGAETLFGLGAAWREAGGADRP